MKHNFVLRKDVVVSRELLYIFMKKIISDLEFNSKAVLGIYLHKVYLAVRVLLRGITSAKSQWSIVPGNASSVPPTLYFELGALERIHIVFITEYLYGSPTSYFHSSNLRDDLSIQ